ncbi:MAG: AMP-binding protein, partial [Lacisediminihabitans sp.]
MTRALAVVPADPHRVLVALRDALNGDGPAILPRDADARAVSSASDHADLPTEVPQRVALVVETSGSTGVPKRVMLSADALLSSAAASESALGGPGQWLLALPAHYIAGVNVLVRSIASGTEPVILPEGHFDAKVFVEASDELDAPLRFASLVPTQLLRLLDAAEQDLPVLERLRRFDRLLIGGQATPPGLVARALELGLNISRSYGSSETSGGCVYDGVALPGVELRILDGEVQIGGSTLAEGYLGDEALTERTFLDDRGQRWYRTGDAGEVDDVLSISGRLDSVIISGGVNVSLAAIERAATALPGLADAVAVSAPSAEWGEVSSHRRRDRRAGSDVASRYGAVRRACAPPD